MGEQGRVILRVLVSSDGVPEKVELRTSSGSARLDESALDTVKRWKFVPARQGDQPVAAWVLVPISFSLARLTSDGTRSTAWASPTFSRRPTSSAR